MSGEDTGQCGLISPSNEDDKGLFTAISYGKVHRISSLLAKTEDLNIRDARSRTPLIHAIFIQKDDVRAHVVRMLLRHGCDVNAEDADGRTALMYASMEEDKVDSVRLLIRCKKCNPNIQDKDGYTALMHAAVTGNISAIRVLISHANTKKVLNVNAVNKQGLTALELSVKLRLKDACKILVYEGFADKGIKDRAALFDILKGDGSRTTTPFGIQSVTSPRYVFSPRLAGTPSNQFPLRTSPFTRQNSDLYRRVLLSPSAEITSPIPRRVQNTSEIYHRFLDSPNAQFPVSPREMTIPRLTQLDFPYQSTSSRRPLTPITPRNSVIKGTSPSPVHNNTLPQPHRLPSIPSGKRVHVTKQPESPT